MAASCGIEVMPACLGGLIDDLPSTLDGHPKPLGNAHIAIYIHPHRELCAETDDECPDSESLDRGDEP